MGRTGARFPAVPDAAGPDAAGPDAAGPDAAAPPAPEQADPAGAAPPAVPDPSPPPRPLVGRTGARFDSRARREDADPAGGPLALPPAAADAARAEAPGVPAPGGAADPAQPPDPMVGRTGARFASNARRRRRDAEREAAQDAVVPTQARPVTCPRRGDPYAPPADESPTVPLSLAELRARVDGLDFRVSVRPYVRTRGRTRSRTDLRVETLVSLPTPRPPLDDPEHRAIGDLCDTAPRSVAEVAALIRVPLGVARVLIGDMADDGALTIHPTAGLSDGPGPDREVMARVLRGLHHL